MHALTENERLVLALFKDKGVGPNEIVNHHQLTRNLDWSVVQADELNNGLQGLQEKGLLEPGKFLGWFQLTEDGFRHL